MKHGTNQARPSRRHTNAMQVSDFAIPGASGVMRMASLGILLACVGCGQTGPLNLTLEEQKVIDVAQDYLKKSNLTWKTPTEIKRPPNRVNVPDWKKYLDEEKDTWKVVYETPNEEMRALGARTLFVNLRTNEVRPNARK